ncbi:LMBR1-like membrane protein-domain-containing protein [Chytriomyces sp. MP71]|nr:LMBR1-like membrane protein-domain-containing protein [Chytriomyces sp. MP71]
MVDIVLIVLSAIFAIMVLASSVYFLIYYQHPTDKWVAWLPKVVVVFGLTLSAFNIFVLPLDVANQSGQINASGGLPMASITLALNLSSVFFFIVFVPFTMFYYEGADDSDESDEKKKSAPSQIGYALKWLIPTMIFTGGIVGVMYWQLGYAEIGVTQLAGTLQSGFDLTVDYCALTVKGTPVCARQSGTRYPKVSWIVYTVALIGLIGWFIFAIFGGAGLISLPVDMIQDFQHRPKPITAAEYAERKKAIGQQSVLLIEVGQTLQDELKLASRGGARMNRRFRQLRTKENEFRKDALILEFHYRRLEESYKAQGGNILLQYLGLIGGCVSAVISVIWIIHIALYMLPNMFGATPYSLFLNDFFGNVSPIPFIGVFFYAIFSFYLLLCVIKGNSKLGMRIAFITIHPLRLGETMMNSLLFNVGVILVSSLAVSQFCTLAFSRYAKYTASGYLFGVQIQKLKGMQYVYLGFVCAFLGVALMTIAWIIYKPRSKQRENRMNFKW